MNDAVYNHEQEKFVEELIERLKDGVDLPNYLNTHPDRAKYNIKEVLFDICDTVMASSEAEHYMHRGANGIFAIGDDDFLIDGEGVVYPVRDFREEAQKRNWFIFYS